MSTNEITEEVEITIRKLFNKLKSETFEQVFKDFTNIEFDGKDHLIRLVVDVIMNKVVTKSTKMKPGLFAKLISRYDRSFKLKKEILARCQAEFRLGVENADKIKISENNLKLFQNVEHLKSELDSFKSKSIKCSVANIQLIGEFYNYDVAGTGAIMEYVDALLSRNDDVSVTILCALMKTIGPKLYATVELLKKYEEKPTKLNLPRLKEKAEFVNWVNKIFEYLRMLPYLSLNSEAAIQEILELQEKKWKTEEIMCTPPITPIPITAMPVNSTVTNPGSDDFLAILKQRKIDAEVVKLLKQLKANNASQIAQKFSSQPIEWYGERIVSIIYKMFEMSLDTVKVCNSCASLVKIFCTKSYRSSKVFQRSLATLCQAEIQYNKSYAIWLKMKEDNLPFRTTCSQHAKICSALLEDEISLGRKRFRGNVRFIGELFNAGILTFQFVKDAVDELMDTRDDGNLESLCMLLKTAGEKMHKENGKCTTKMFKSLAILANNGEVSVAMKTVIMGVVDLSAKRWELSSISKSSSLMSVSSNSTSAGAIRQNDVSKEIGKLVVAMSSVSKPNLVLEKKEEEFELIRAQLERSVDTVSSSSSSRDMIPGGTICSGYPGTSKSVHSIENNSEIGTSLSSPCPPPQLKYLSMYTNYDRMLKQMPHEVVEDINMEISTIIYQRFKHQKELESFSTSQNDFENDMFTMI